MIDFHIITLQGIGTVSYTHLDVYKRQTGPTATVLSYELSKNGIQAIDTGNLDMEFEWFIRNVDNPVAIDGKYSHETVGCSINNSANTMDYNNQIVDVIK